MKTTAQTFTRFNLSVKSTLTTITNRILQTSVLVTKYSYWFLSVLIFFSCQKNLTLTNESTGTVSQTTETAAEKFLVVDTAKYTPHFSSLSLADSAVIAKVQEKTNRFYAANSFKTKWMDTNNPSPLYYALINNLKNAADFGLEPKAYNAEHIEHLLNMLYNDKFTASNDLVDADIRITETFFLFAIHLREGRITDPGHRGKMWIAHNRVEDHSDVAMLVSVQNSSEFDEMIKKLQPAHEQYVKLQKLLVQYRSLETSDGAHFSISTRETIKPGTRHPSIPAIRQKLWLIDIQTTDAKSGNTDSLYYDTALVSAVKVFQKRHGLVEDGIISGKTVVYLNQSFKVKADLIALNMERMRWLPETHAQYIRVNIPEYKLRIYEQGTQTLEMNVIVGAVSSATPVFSDTLEHVVLNPTWTVPPSLVKAEFLPRLKKNKMYYAKRQDFAFYRNGVEIDPSTVNWDSIASVHEFRIVQKPGRDNALGLAKFIMPNDMNIYLHDTPDHKPFSDSYRALSHGCIRLSDPTKLATYLLQEETGWDAASIKKAMTSGKPTKIEMNKKYQVNLEYNTVWVDDNGNLNFGEDIYGHDKRHLQRLNQLNTISNLVASR
jgi:L,D-transpeptidase YcbB